MPWIYQEHHNKQLETTLIIIGNRKINVENTNDLLKIVETWINFKGCVIWYLARPDRKNAFFIINSDHILYEKEEWFNLLPEKDKLEALFYMDLWR